MNKVFSLLVLLTIIFGVGNNDCYSAKRYVSTKSNKKNNVINQIRLFDALCIMTKNPRVRNLSQNTRAAINDIVARGNIYRKYIIQLREVINNRVNALQTREIMPRNERVFGNNIQYITRLNHFIRSLSRINSILMNINTILRENNNINDNTLEILIRAEILRWNQRLTELNNSYNRNMHVINSYDKDI